MSLQQLKKKSEGFTIIEVLIVLAIAGLILLVVFMAVPALQRNSRNTQRKSDISALLGAVSEFTSNNNGKLPTEATDITALSKTGFYSGTGGGQGQVNLIVYSGGAAAALPADSANDRVVVVTGAKCDAGGAVVAGAARSVAVQYLTETSASFTPSCQES
jgi:prepilin-type N-terminal cleavage/methylation domain-containing protein